MDPKRFGASRGKKEGFEIQLRHLSFAKTQAE